MNIGKYLSNKSKININDKSFVIRLPKSMLALGVSGILIPFLLLLGMVFFEEDASLGQIIFTSFFFGIMAFIGVCLIVRTLLYKIIIQDNKITVYPIIGKAYTIEFNDIVSVKIAYFVRSETITVTTESKKFSIEYGFVGYEYFVKKIHSKVDPKRIKYKL